MGGMTDAPKFNVAKLKKAIVDHTGPGKKFSRRSLSMKASNDKNPDLVRDFMSRGQDRKPSMELVTGLAGALGMPLSEFISGEVAVPPFAAVTLTVIGAVEAGAWRQHDGWDEERHYQVRALPSTFNEADRFGLEVVGYSMDKIFLPGTVLDCIRVPNASSLEPIPGDIVIVERKQGALIETTCKRLEQLEDGSYQLRAESTRAEFSEPIPCGRPDSDHFDDNETRIIAIVNAAVTSVLRR